MNTIAQKLAEIKVVKPADTLCDAQAMALVDVLAYMLDNHQYEGRDTCRVGR